MRRILVLAATVGLCFAVSACSGGSSSGFVRADVNDETKFSSAQFGVAASPRLTSSSNIPKGGGRYQIGQPYKVAGRWYHPSEDVNYDETGSASWYGPNFHGRLTANGEIFDQLHLSAAHPTLPLPSYVRVENQENGRSVIVRVNDRGPFAHNRLIDLSRRTAEVLGFIEQGTAQVRVTYVGPAPVEGDDTRYLVSTIQAPNGAVPQIGSSIDQSRGPIAPTARNGGLVGSIMSIFSYAPEHAAPVNDDARNAASMLATGNLAVSAQVSDDSQSWKVIGTFSSRATTRQIALEFATLGAIDHNFVMQDGQTLHQLTLVQLKDGVLPSDVADLKNELGI